MVKKISILVFLLFNLYIGSYGQCAMCRATVENSLSRGENNIGAGLNSGILYLMSFPYIVLIVIGFLWYYKSKQNQKRKMKHESIMSRVFNLSK